MEDNILPFKQKINDETISTYDKVENLFEVLKSRVAAYERKTDPRETAAILVEINMIRGLLDTLSKEISSTQEDNLKKVG